MMKLEEERKRQAAEKTEMSRRTEESSHLEELRRQEELKRMERQRLEQMIIQGKSIMIISKFVDICFICRVKSNQWPRLQED